jgi:hypothetical protein
MDKECDWNKEVTGQYYCQLTESWYYFLSFKKNFKVSPVLFTSYEREIMETDDPMRPLMPMTNFTLFDAIRASFASGLYFKRFISAGLGFFDGDLRNLNLSFTALEEAKRIYWYQPNKTCDVLVCIGCGGLFNEKSRSCLE